MKLQALVLLAGTEQAAAISYDNLEPEVVQCSSTTGPDSFAMFSRFELSRGTLAIYF